MIDPTETSTSNTANPGHAPALDNNNSGPSIGAAILREIVETVALFAVVFTIARITVGNYSILGQSMEPNYHETQRLLVDRVSPRLTWLDRGDAVPVASCAIAVVKVRIAINAMIIFFLIECIKRIQLI